MTLVTLTFVKQQNEVMGLKLTAPGLRVRVATNLGYVAFSVIYKWEESEEVYYINV